MSVREAERALSGVLLSGGVRRPLTVLFFLGVVAVTIGSLRPELSVPGPEEASWFAHFVAYAGLAVIGAFAFPGRGRLLQVAGGLVALGGIGGVGVWQVQFGVRAGGDWRFRFSGARAASSGRGDWWRWEWRSSSPSFTCPDATAPWMTASSILAAWRWPDAA